ncbi:MAG TPA: rhodanese-like domain-containing protein [Gemmatimonadaceae bacterium]|nr:rhodanese-like domain-containing protein [Gemmatimonadaceae bacterium]
MKTGQELLDEVKGRITETSVASALDSFRRREHIVFLDVRDPNETSLGRIPGSLAVSRGNLESKIDALVPRDAMVIVYCSNGNRSAFAAETMEVMGYRNVTSMREGFRGWVSAGGDVED